MKVVVGVDPRGRCHSVIMLLGRLAFDRATAVALSAVEEPTSLGLAVPPDMGASISLDISRITEASQKHAQKTAEAAAALLIDMGIPADAKVKFGSPSDKLDEAAHELGADLIAVGSEEKGPMESFFFGSVSSGLCAHSKASVLVARGNAVREGSVHAVFGTDHSGYASRCLQKFVEMRPKGISKVTLMSAYQVTINQNADLFGIPGVEPAIEESFREQVADRLKHASEALKPLGCEVEVLLVEGAPNEGISTAMAETGADLLVLGAKGHSAVERFLLGSVASHQVSHGSYPVMVVRA